MRQTDKSFKTAIEGLVSLVPTGQVTTYGDLAAMAGIPSAARVVGGIAHYGSEQLPWHRVVNHSGGLARGYPGGMASQARHLKLDGVTVTDFKVDNFGAIRWIGPAQ